MSTADGIAAAAARQRVSKRSLDFVTLCHGLANTILYSAQNETRANARRTDYILLYAT